MQMPPPMATKGSGVVHPPELLEVPKVHPPFVQVPPPIAAKGSGVVQPPDEPDVPPEPGGSQPPFTQTHPAPGEPVVQPPVDPPLDAPYTHPPLMHVPPPIAANGSDVVQPPDVPVVPPAPGGSQPPFTQVQPVPGDAVVQPPEVVVPPPPAPGTHPPLRQVPPPMAAKGSDVVQPPELVPPEVGGTQPPFTQVQPVPGEAVVQPPVLVDPPLLPGTQPPLMHVPPPMAANGSGVEQPLVGGGGLFVGGG
jgi:hypothetical protein